ncbi:MAG TPA: DUF2155 domain-containing protein [Xanthobacteraceae bacterium]|nr:DUF2155 domain-containing protein [Xanthobacteraceae bacterium]
MVRIAALVLMIGGALAAGPAAAQFGNFFGDNPPRPPADVPTGPYPQQPPPPQQQYPGQAPAYPSQSYPAQSYPAQSYPAQAYPGQSYPNQAYPGQAAPSYPAAPSAPASIEAQPLPPPPGASAVQPVRPNQPYPQPTPPQRAVGVPPAAVSPAPPANSSPPTATAETPPPDDTVVEAPTPHIENGRAVFAGLDKITGRTFRFDAAIGETVQFGALQVTPRACYTRPPTEATNTDAFVEVDEVTLQGEIKRIFTGWMFASSPGLNAIEHPVYDVWLTDCAAPVQTSLAEPATHAEPSTPARRPPPRPPRAVPGIQGQPR